METVPVTSTNTDRAIDILSAAFHDDPVMNWSCNHPPSLAPFFQVTLPIFLPHGLTYLDPQGRGAACWLGPGEKLRWPVTLSSVVRIVRLGGLRGLYRMLRSGYYTEKHHPGEPHYYLFAIGVTPHNAGRGIGTALISSILRRCDDEQMPAYLENSKADNLPFYEGHGFRVIGEIRFARSAPPVWLMWRDPIAAGK
ncbi:MAG: GNAT family N-acetyltransferase [Halioglobus sp.]|nr:GNAT family N-acetyltransferase [Halioglobus sp.]